MYRLGTVDQTGSTDMLYVVTVMYVVLTDIAQILQPKEKFPMKYNRSWQTVGY